MKLVDLDAHTPDVLAYETLIQRELEQDSMMWQTPALALTAQAFLLTIALNTDLLAWPRLVAATLGVVVAGASMQLMAKHRLLGEVDGLKMRDLEARLDLVGLRSREYRDADGKPVQFAVVRGGEILVPHDSVWRRRSSYRVWQGALATFLVANVAAIVAAVLQWVGVTSP